MQVVEKFQQIRNISQLIRACVMHLITITLTLYSLSKNT